MIFAPLRCDDDTAVVVLRNTLQYLEPHRHDFAPFFRFSFLARDIQTKKESALH